MKGARGGGAHFGLSPSRSSQVCLQTHESCFPGGLGCVCCLLWFTVIYDDPARHPCISVREKEHIVSSLAPQVRAPALAAQRPRGGRAPEGPPSRPNTHTDEQCPFSPPPADALSPSRPWPDACLCGPFSWAFSATSGYAPSS